MKIAPVAAIGTAAAACWSVPLRARVDALTGDADAGLALVLAVMRREIAVFDAVADSSASIWFMAGPAA